MKLWQNPLLDADSYKVSHWPQYPKGTTKMFSYIESRGGKFDRTVVFGLMYMIQEYFAGPIITKEIVEQAKAFWEGHGMPFNYDGWMKVVNVYGGRLPVRIRAVPEGSVVPTHNILVSIESTDPELFWIASWLETQLVRMWYATNVATISYHARKLIGQYLAETSDCGPEEVLFKLHDFGGRGATCREAATIGGCAHLINFRGSDTGVGVALANEMYKCPMSAWSIPACYDDETEILSEDGFVLFKDLDEKTKVAQYTKEGNIEFVYPENIYNVPYSGNLITFTTKGKTAKIDLVVTPNHRMVRRSLTTNELEIFQANDISFSQRNEIPQAGLGVGPITRFTPLDALRIAFQADGSFVSRKDRYTGEKTGCKPIRFSLKKKRKCERLRVILKELNYEYFESKSNDKIHFWIKVPNDVLMVKDFSWIDITQISSTWAKKAIEELTNWDGQIKNNTLLYHSTNYDTATVVQCVGVLSGHRSVLSEYEDPRDNRKTIYTVMVCPASGRNGLGIKKGTIEYNGIVYCVTVPSGMVVVRRNNFVAISGNSEHSTITSWGRENEEKAYENMLEVYGGNGKVLACVSDSYDIFNACENIWGGTLKQKVIDSGATLVIRPDSGDPKTVVLKVLEILGNKFGTTTNSKGFKVLKYVRVIQGDGVNLDSIEEILEALKEVGWSTENITFGMGGALLQQHNRDTQRFAMKCSWVIVNGEEVEVFKQPATDQVKNSKRGRLDLIRKINDAGFAVYETVKLEKGQDVHPDTVMQEVFLNGDVFNMLTMEEVRENAWPKEPLPPGWQLK
jgi:nicotinic acid phosphoribosyltransferase